MESVNSAACLLHKGAFCAHSNCYTVSELRNISKDTHESFATTAPDLSQRFSFSECKQRILTTQWHAVLIKRDIQK